MGQPSFQASNAIIYLTYGLFLYIPSDICTTFLSLLRTDSLFFFDGRFTGLCVAWFWRHQSKAEFIASNRTQKGQIPLADSSVELTHFQSPTKTPLLIKANIRC